ncbi:hypothetical protein NDU88_005934 [Pleurodeles waltl]|uniref:Uncharacterized protein n=1 Tax=Pleurodeles waltl TaxID=8319 RepID=A0AAV7WYI7_PLEWA|nr:hypothetical protein NDU88_005934 [Pleurodeles waltl]
MTPVLLACIFRPCTNLECGDETRYLVAELNRGMKPPTRGRSPTSPKESNNPAMSDRQSSHPGKSGTVLRVNRSSNFSGRKCHAHSDGVPAVLCTRDHVINNPQHMERLPSDGCTNPLVKARP